MESTAYFSIKKENDSITAVFNENCTKIDAKNYSEIEADAESVIRDMTEREFIFDLKNVVYVSSAGLRMFSSINTAVAETGAEYRLINLKNDILKMFQLTGYSSMFKVERQPEY